MVRLDVFLVENGYFDSREKAKAEIIAGNVLVNEKRLKPGEQIKPDAVIRVIQKMPFVSRGGYKLAKAVDVFGLQLNDKICIDVGASTGGFTDVMLQNGAKLVYSVDVGYGQLDYKLRENNKVVVMERTNARHLSLDNFEFQPQFAGMDVSFISILLIFPIFKQILTPDAKIMALIKPQFEAGKELVGKNGVVRDANVHKMVIENIKQKANESGMFLHSLDFSPITGPEGNIEFISLWGFEDVCAQIDIEKIVDAAHEYKF